MFLFGFLAHHSMLRLHAARLDSLRAFTLRCGDCELPIHSFWSLLQVLKLHVVSWSISTRTRRRLSNTWTWFNCAQSSQANQFDTELFSMAIYFC